MATETLWLMGNWSRLPPFVLLGLHSEGSNIHFYLNFSIVDHYISLTNLCMWRVLLLLDAFGCFGHLVLDLFCTLVSFVAPFEALAGGSGITPVLSLLRQCREECRSSFAKPNAKHDLIKEFSIIHAMRSMDERPLSYERVQQLREREREREHATGCNSMQQLNSSTDTRLQRVRRTATPRDRQGGGDRRGMPKCS